MSEPKTVARTVTEIVPGLFHFMIDDERIKTQSDAYALVANGRIVLIDPVPLDAGQLARLGKVEAIVLGTPSHQRSAWSYRREHKAKVHAPEDWTGLDEKPDATFKAGDTLPLGLKPLHAPGPAAAHHVFHVAGKPGALLCTDLWHVGSKGIEFLPDKYMNDPGKARESARRLLEVDFDVLCFGHGDPIMTNARKVLSDVVRKDAEARKGKA
jgi:glyoxylase-like metal-dependent hydrolase (beta-lactamase superfamily II)